MTPHARTETASTMLCRALAIALAWLLLVPLPTGAGDGGIGRLPLPGDSNPSGLAIMFDNQWVAGAGGYRPVRVTISTAKGTPSPATRTLSIEVSNQSPFKNANSATGLLELAQGTAQASTTLLVPQTFDGGTMWSVKVTENGNELDDLTGRDLQYASIGNTFPFADALRMLFVHSEVPTRAQLQKLLQAPASATTAKLPTFAAIPGYLGRQQSISWQSDDLAQLREINTQMPHLAALAPGEVPTEWLALTALDIISLPIEDAIGLHANRPEAWEAILQWAHAGGYLFVYGTKESPASPDKLAPLVWGENVPPAPLADSDSDSPVFPLGLGRCAVAGSRFEFGTSASPQAFSGRQVQIPSFSERHGLTYSGDNPAFWNFLIAGVGLPPTGAFVVLITLFAICLGPLNYFLLKRNQRLYLLLFTVPAGALLATLGLLLYAMLGDGLGTRLRVRSVTTLDQRTGLVSAISRQSLFAGLAPSGGAVLPRDTAVYQLLPNASENEHVNRGIDWSDQRQRLALGYIRSRSMLQFITVRSRRTDARLPITLAPDGKTGTAENQLGTTIRQLWVTDKQGQIFYASEIEPGAQGTLAPMAQADATTAWEREVSESKLTAPEGLNFNSNGYRWNRRRYVRFRPQQQGTPTASYSGSLLESRLRELTYALRSSPAAEQGKTAFDLPTSTSGATAPPREPRFIALVEGSPEVPLCVGSATVTDGLHVIEGNW